MTFAGHAVAPGDVVEGSEHECNIMLALGWATHATDKVVSVADPVAEGEQPKRRRGRPPGPRGPYKRRDLQAEVTSDETVIS